MFIEQNRSHFLYSFYYLINILSHGVEKVESSGANLVFDVF